MCSLKNHSWMIVAMYPRNKTSVDVAGQFLQSHRWTPATLPLVHPKLNALLSGLRNCINDTYDTTLLAWLPVNNAHRCTAQQDLGRGDSARHSCRTLMLMPSWSHSNMYSVVELAELV